MAFWTRVEAWLLDLQRNPERAARWFRAAYWVSLGFVLFGFAVIVNSLVRKGIL